MTEKFLTIRDLDMSPHVAALWGDVGRTPETYPANYGTAPQDAALNHMVLLLLNRCDHDGAKQYAHKIADPNFRTAILAVIECRRNKTNH